MDKTEHADTIRARSAPPAEEPLIETKYADIYPADIERVEQNYIASLPDPESIYNVNSFIGLLFTLHRELIKPALNRPGDIKTGCKGYDIYALDNIFYGLFIPLIAKYRITPTMGLFHYLTGLDTSIINRWKKPNNTYSNDNNIYIDSNSNDNDVLVKKNNIDKYSFYQKWSKYIEQWILQNAVSSNSIGSIFALKAVYGYSDAQTIRVEPATTAPAISEAQLTAIAANAAQLPGETAD